MTPKQTNPFELVYDTVCGVIEARGVQVKSWNKTREPPTKDVPGEGDFPEVQVRISACEVTVTDSRSLTVKRTHDVVVNTGDFRLGYRLFPIEWKLLGAAYDLKYGTKLNEIRYKERDLVTDSNISGIQSGLSDPTAQGGRGISGWTTLWSVIVHLMLDKDDLQ